MKIYEITYGCAYYPWKTIVKADNEMSALATLARIAPKDKLTHVDVREIKGPVICTEEHPARRARKSA